MNWYLKNEDDSVFGPVAEAMLYRWVIQGRVAPEHLVSDDQQLWRKAHEIDAFHMDWFVELKDESTAGPLNLLSLKSFIDDGEVTLKTRVSHKTTEETHYLDEALCPELIRDLTSLLSDMEQVEKQLEVAKKDAEEYQNIAAQQMLHGPDPETDEYKRIKEASDKKDDFEAAAKKWEAECVSLKKHAAEQGDKLKGQVASLTADKQTLEKKLQDRGAELEAAKSNADTAKVEASSKSKQSRSAARQTANEKAKEKELLEAEKKEWQKTLRQTESEAAARELELKQRINKLMDEQNQLRDTLAVATAKKTKTEAQQDKPASSKDKTQAVQPDVTAGSWKEVVKSRDHFQKEAGKWKKLYDEERNEADLRGKEKSVADRDMKKEELERRTEMEQTTRKLRQLEKKYEAMRQMGAGAEQDPAASIQSQILSMQDTYAQLSESNDTLLQQLSEKNEEIKSLVESRKSAEANAAERVKHMEEIVQREQTEADSARQRLADIEETHHQLIKSYRDMNDRFIRMKQEQIERGTGIKKTPDEPTSSPGKKKDKGSGRRLRLS